MGWKFLHKKNWGDGPGGLDTPWGKSLENSKLSTKARDFWIAKIVAMTFQSSAHSSSISELSSQQVGYMGAGTRFGCPLDDLSVILSPVFFFDLPQILVDFGVINGRRTPSHHRLDFGFHFKKKLKRTFRTFSVGVYNAYGRRNPFYMHAKLLGA